MKASDVMNRSIVSIETGRSVHEAALLLSTHRVSGLPVIDHNGAPLGMVTEFDIISKQGRTVDEIMTKGLISVSEDTDLDSISHMLTSQNIRRVAVVSGSRLIGIVSRADLVREIAYRWVCEVCGEMMRGERPPENCPKCGTSTKSLIRQIMPPGM